MNNYTKVVKPMGLFKLQWLCLVRSKKIRLIALIAIIPVLFFYTINLMYAHVFDPINELQNNKQQLQQAITKMKQNTSDQSAAKLEALRSMKSDLSLLEQQIDAHQAGQWRDELAAQIRYDQATITEINNGSTTGPSIVDTESQIKTDRWLLSKSIHPEINTYETKGINFTYRLIFYLFPLLLVLLLTVLLANSSEQSEIWANLYPVPLRRVFNARISASFIFGTVFVIGIFVVAFIIGSLIRGPGSFAYPIVIYNSDQSRSLQPISLFLSECLILITCLVLFINILIQSLSLWIKNSFAVILIVVGCFFISTLPVLTNSVVSGVLQYVPFTFADVAHVVSGETAMNLHNPDITVFTGIATLLVASGLLYLISCLTLAKRQRI